MKRKSIKLTVYIIAALVAVVVGLTMYKAVVASAETDKQLEYIDKRIARYEAESKNYHHNYIVEEEVYEPTTIASGNDDICIDYDGAVDTPDHSGSVADQELGQVVMSPEDFRYHGVIDWNGWRYTYYSEYVLPGEGLNIPGRWSDGNFVRDENGYLCVASNEHEYGSIVATPFGDAIVYDAIGDGVKGIIDIYVSF